MFKSMKPTNMMASKMMNLVSITKTFTSIAAVEESTTKKPPTAASTEDTSMRREFSQNPNLG